MKIITIVGARPQFVKAAVVSRAIGRANAGVAGPGIRELIVHTGQHFDAAMSDVFFEELSIPRPAFHLGIGGLGHGAMTGRMLEAIERVLIDEKPDWVLVYGDTNSTLAGALAAVKLHISVAHVEAGLRSFNRRMPEEINRVLTDHASDLLFAPTDVAVGHLRGEGHAASKIVRSGDVMYDAALFYAEQARTRSTIAERLRLRSREFVLATIHRAENTDDLDRLAVIFDALSHLSGRFPVVLPIHPRTRSRIAAASRFADAIGNVTLIDPVGYLDMVALQQLARLIVTDSGGVQKEAFFFGVPCVTLRDETEWTELVEAGANRLASPNSVQTVLKAFDQALASTVPNAARSELYGDGDAARKIVDALRGRLNR